MKAEALKEKIDKCNVCNNDSPNRGFGWGNLKSKLMFVAQNPGWSFGESSYEIVPFGLDVLGGEGSGKYFVRLLNELKIDKKKDFYITNVVKCPFEFNACPRQKHVDNCIDFLHMEIEIQQPRYIVLFGTLAHDAFMGYVGRLIAGLKTYPVYHEFLYHPSYIARKPYLFESWKNKLDTFLKEYKWRS